MYASYNMLYNDCAQTPSTAYTDSSRFVCSSLPIQKQVRKSIYSDQMFPMDVPCTHDCEITDPSCQYQCALPQKSSVSNISLEIPSETRYSIPLLQQPTRENFKVTYSDAPTHTVAPKTKLADQSHEKLLPVMRPEFNLREICKQCILLEDHLSHHEKRCFDCCVKHFLTIEALAEEAITLDNNCSSELQELPSVIRNLQSQWHQDPDNNAISVSQELRKIRKEFQIDAFDVVFRYSCDNGVCQVK